MSDRVPDAAELARENAFLRGELERARTGQYMTDADRRNLEELRYLADRGKPIGNIEAEAALLGAMMIDNRLIDEIGAQLTREDFLSEINGEIYALCLKLHLEGKEANPVTLRPYVEHIPPAVVEVQDEWGRPKQEEVKITMYVAQLTGSGAAIIGARDFAEQVRDLAVLRRMEEACEEGIRRIRDTREEIEPARIAADAAAEILRLSEKANPVKIRSAAGMMKLTLERNAEVSAGKSRGAFCASVSDFNDVIGPLTPGSYTAIGGRPSMGKSVLMQSLLWGYARNGFPALGISLEMHDDDLSMRMAADLSFAMGEGVPYDAIRKGRMGDHDQRILRAVAEKVEQMPLAMVSPGRNTIEEIEALAMRHASALDRKGLQLGVLGVDYIQIIGCKNKKLQGREKIDHISERLLELFKRLGCGGLVLSQLSREVEKRPDKRPQTSDLKESGRIEEDAVNVCLVYRPEFYLQSSEPPKGEPGSKEATEYLKWYEEYQASKHRVDLIFPKVRHGVVGVRRARFYGANQAIRGSDFREDIMGEGSLL